MRITDVQAYVLQGERKYTDPAAEEEAVGVWQCCLVRVTTDEGLVGWSDVETQPVIAKACIDAPHAGGHGFEGLRELCLGEDPFETERLWEKCYRGSIYYGRRGAAIQALSGIDIACWDIAGKAAKRPVASLLGGAQRSAVRAYASTLFRPTPDAMKRACASYLERGFTAVKFGWGVFGRDARLDEQLVRAARQALGDGITLLVDPGWDVPRTAFDALETARMLDQYGVFWMEDFLNPEDYAGYARVAEGVEKAGLDVRIAAGEQEATAPGFRRLISEGRVHVAQPDLSRCGGLTVARKIGWLAREASIDVCPHAWLTDLLTTASLHFNATLPKALFLEYNVCENPMLRDIVANPVKLNAGGTLDVPTEPGLGIEIDEKAVEKYRVA
ncbi:MAG: mandelate racemase/muconate lactonizing enzyme family protein [Planctomycetes bacterium]|nr:mandelate racemase/muconate lactonizing enzyme family protein [Planctomycetota bacterium]